MATWRVEQPVKYESRVESVQLKDAPNHLTDAGAIENDQAYSRLIIEEKNGRKAEILIKDGTEALDAYGIRVELV